MDPVTHLASGALAGQALRDRVKAPAWLVLLYAMLACWIPDVDNILGLGPEGYLLYHRGVTHSVFGVAGFGMLLALAFPFVRRRFGWWRAAALSALLVCVPIWLDLVTSYGTQLLAPLSRHRFALPSLFIIDPGFTLALLILLGMSWALPARRTRLALAGLALVVFWPLASLGVRQATATALPTVMAERGLESGRVELTTAPFSPLFWKVVVTHGDTMRTAVVSCVPTASDLDFEVHRRADQALLESLAAQSSLWDTWNWFAAYPTMEERPLPGNGREVTFTDQRFVLQGAAARLLPARRTPFTITAVLGPDDELQRTVYHHPGRVLHREHPD